MWKVLSKNKNEFILFDFLFWVLLAIIFPLVTGNLNVVNCLHVFLYLSAVYYVGELLLCRIDTINSIPFILKSGIYIIFGGIVCGLLFLLISTDYILYSLSFIFFIDLFVSKRVIISFSLREFLALSPFLIILFQTHELAYATAERITHMDGDYYYYTAVVESIKTNHSLNNAIFHTGIPINYMVAPFLAPGQLAEFSDIPAQFTLWGVYLKILPVISFGIISYTIVRIYEILFNLQLNKNSFLKRQLLVALMLLFLAPLHFLNLIKLYFGAVLLLGEGYLLPIGSPGYALSIAFAGLILLLALSKSKYSVLEQVSLIVFLCIITASKIALFLPIGVFLGTISILRLFKKQAQLFITLLLALPFCIIVYKLTLGIADALTVMEFTKNGYYLSFFEELASDYGISGSTGKKVFLMTVVSVFMWLSIKLVILAISGLSLLKNNYKAVTLIVVAIIGFAICLLPGFFINVYGRDANGVFLFDGRFDMAQFA
ncbi:MAG: hypothetical protein ABR503_16585, partial [Chitinophagaceae bacterium]